MSRHRVKYDGSGSRLVLASASPRRSQLLADAGYSFDTLVPDVNEDVAVGETFTEFALRLAMEKASTVASIADTEAVVLGADTIVVCQGRLYGKPRDRADAVAILQELTGRNHEVVTAWALASPPRLAAGIVGFSRSVVRMREASREEITAYVNTGEPMDKAGAYAAQGGGQRLVAAIFGPLDNVIGLPVAPVARALAAFGIYGREKAGE